MEGLAEIQMRAPSRSRRAAGGWTTWTAKAALGSGLTTGLCQALQLCLGLLRAFLNPLSFPSASICGGSAAWGELHLSKIFPPISVGVEKWPLTLELLTGPSVQCLDSFMFPMGTRAALGRV